MTGGECGQWLGWRIAIKLLGSDADVPFAALERRQKARHCGQWLMDGCKGRGSISHVNSPKIGGRT
jgi:hypothetical protein